MKFFYASVAFVGWLLSPFTWWNDAFVNLPLAYILTSLIQRWVPWSFLSAFLVCYWITNIAGIALMYAGARRLVPRAAGTVTRRGVLATIIAYSIIAALLIKLGIIKPL